MLQFAGDVAAQGSRVSLLLAGVLACLVVWSAFEVWVLPVTCFLAR